MVIDNRCMEEWRHTWASRPTASISASTAARTTGSTDSFFKSSACCSHNPFPTPPNLSRPPSVRYAQKDSTDTSTNLETIPVSMVYMRGTTEGVTLPTCTCTPQKGTFTCQERRQSIMRFIECLRNNWEY